MEGFLDVDARSFIKEERDRGVVLKSFDDLPDYADEEKEANEEREG